MYGSVACLAAPERGPAPALTLAACREAGCDHAECAAAEAAHERVTPPVLAAGAARRLQALAYNGHGPAALAARLGFGDDVLAVAGLQFGRVAEIPAALAEAVAVLYDAIWDVPGTDAPAADFAARRGWCPPLAWDDDDEDGHGIDDPDAVPADWRPRRATLADRAEDITEVLAQGATVHQAAWRLGISRNHLSKLTSRVRARRAAGGAA